MYIYQKEGKTDQIKALYTGERVKTTSTVVCLTICSTQSSSSFM